MLFEWDEAKSQQTLQERGFGFDYAARVFLGPTLEQIDDRKNYGEVRVQATSCLLSTLIVPMRGISFRRGSPAERSARYGSRSSNNGEHPAAETANQSCEN